MTRLSVRGLHKAFGRVEALRGVDLDVPARSLTAVLGPSGCGKTTLLRLVAGFELPDGGSIRFGDQLVAGDGVHVAAQRRRVGFVPQEGALFPHLTVAANIAFGLPRSERRSRRRVDQLLELVGLGSALGGRQPHQLSGGQQQRVALARALAPRPSVVLLDEPFASLDAALREETGRLVTRALHDAGATALLVTHDQGEALSLADQVAVMFAGRIAQVDAPDALYGTPSDPTVAEFVGAAVVLPAMVSGTSARCALGEIQVAGPTHQGEARVVVRPEQIELVAPGDGGVAAEVVDVSYYGHDATVRLRLMDGEQVVARVTGRALPVLGDKADVRVRGAGRAYPEPVRPG